MDVVVCEPFGSVCLFFNPLQLNCSIFVLCLPGGDGGVGGGGGEGGAGCGVGGGGGGGGGGEGRRWVPPSPLAGVLGRGLLVPLATGG